MKKVLSGRIRVISLDITGTILVYRQPIAQTYAQAALWVKFPDPPSASEFAVVFKKAYKHNHKIAPCFGSTVGKNGRQWWEQTFRDCLAICGRSSFQEDDFQRYFRAVYQHFATPESHEQLSDAIEFVQWAHSRSTSRGLQAYSLGIATNSPSRSVETVLPAQKLHHFFQWFVSCEDIGFEKPQIEFFDKVFLEASKFTPNLQRSEVLHVGDNLATDFCGARAAGFQAIFLDRTSNPRATIYQDWLEGPNYQGKCEEDILSHTVKDFNEIRLLLENN